MCFVGDKEVPNFVDSTAMAEIVTVDYDEDVATLVNQNLLGKHLSSGESMDGSRTIMQAEQEKKTDGPTPVLAQINLARTGLGLVPKFTWSSDVVQVMGQKSDNGHTQAASL